MPRPRKPCPSRSNYVGGCRCEGCRKAHARHQAQWRKSKAPDYRILHGRLVHRTEEPPMD